MWDHRTGVSVGVRRELLTLHLPIARPVFPAREVRVCKRHGVGRGQSELGADVTSVLLP